MIITPALLKLKTQLQEVADEYGSFCVDLQVTVYGRAVCYHCKATSNINPELVYEVAGKEDTILGNLKKALEGYDKDLIKARFANQIFPGVNEALDELTIIK